MSKPKVDWVVVPALLEPMQMTVEELEGGVRWLFTEMYNETQYIRRKPRYMEIVKACSDASFELPNRVF